MNCANHADVPAVAYCRTCGKPLCATCTRDVRGVIYCENCLAARLEGMQPPTPPPPPPAPAYAPIMPTSGPNPTVAGILAGFFPFGVGAVYNSQYAKGLAHLLIFAGLIWGMDHGGRWDFVFVIGFLFFYVYQIIDAVRSSRAIQLGQPAPDPFGLGQALGAGEKADTTKVPTLAVVLIGIGVLFLMHTMGLFELNFDRIWPVFLIALGVWLFARRWGLLGPTRNRCVCDRCRACSLMGPAVLVAVGTVFLLDSVHLVGADRTWPVIILAIGIIKLLQGNASSAGHVPPPLAGGSISPPPASTSTSTTISAQAQPPVDEVKNV